MTVSSSTYTEFEFEEGGHYEKDQILSTWGLIVYRIVTNPVIVRKYGCPPKYQSSNCRALSETIPGWNFYD